MTELEKRDFCVCFTGHHPEKLSRTESEVKADLEKEIRRAIADGITVFITGMARGVDIWAAEIVLQFRENGLPIKLVCASPYDGFECGWKASWQEKYAAVRRAADLVRFISPEYSRLCFQVRNKWMVDHSSRVIAVFNGTPGGAKNTIDYARRIGVEVKLIDG